MPEFLFKIVAFLYEERVGITIDFRACAVKVEDCFPFLGIDCDLELYWTAVVHVVDSM